MHQLSYVREASPGLPIFTYYLRNKQLNFTLLKNQDFIFLSDFFYFNNPEKLEVSIWLKTLCFFHPVRSEIMHPSPDSYIEMPALCFKNTTIKKSQEATSWFSM